MCNCFKTGSLIFPIEWEDQWCRDSCNEKKEREKKREPFYWLERKWSHWCCALTSFYLIMHWQPCWSTLPVVMRLRIPKKLFYHRAKVWKVEQRKVVVDTDNQILITFPNWLKYIKDKYFFLVGEGCNPSHFYCGLFLHWGDSPLSFDLSCWTITTGPKNDGKSKML